MIGPSMRTEGSRALRGRGIALGGLKGRHMAEFNWDRLLRRIDDGAVVPVIGQELLRQEVDGKTVSLGGMIAQRLAKSLEIEIEPQPFFELNDVVSTYLSRPGTVPSELYQDIAWIYKEVTRTLPVPTALMQLAAIGKFDLFVNLGFDSMLACALNRARFAGACGTREIAFSMNQSTDSQEQALKPPPEGTPVVFNLFGRASSTDDYVIHDEDALEFIHRLVSGDVEPPQWLLSRLRSADLLVLGVHLPDWLGRFVLRAANRDRLSCLGADTSSLAKTQRRRPHSTSFSAALVARRASMFMTEPPKASSTNWRGAGSRRMALSLPARRRHPRRRRLTMDRSSSATAAKTLRKSRACTSRSLASVAMRGSIATN